MFANNWRFLAAAFLLCLLSLLSAPAKAQITVGGDAGEVSPVNPATWTSSTSVQIGIDSAKTGSVTVAGGSSVSSSQCTLAVAAGSSGTVIITGLNSNWTSKNGMCVGMNGIGMLTVENQAKVTTSPLFLGYYGGSQGSATVTGVGSNLTNDYLYVGYVGFLGVGTGTLSVANGGQVTTNYDGYLSSGAGSTSMATVTGAGSTWTSSRLLVDPGSILTVANGGTVNTKTLYASPSCLAGNGTINTKGLVSDMDLVFDATHGQILSFGTGGTLNLNFDGTGDLGVGYSGAGSLRVADGVKVASSSGYLGGSAGSSGTAVITGPGSSWANSSTLYVGQNGAGTLTVENGGTVSSSSCYIGYVGTGIATITGAGTAWTNSGNLYVGNSGTGTLTVASGGVVTTGTLYVSSPNDLKGNGTINAKGLVSDMDLVYDATHGQGHVLSFGTGGTLNLSLDGTGDLGVGNSGDGSLRVADGVKVASSSGYLGRSLGSSGSALITGPGSSWANSSTLYVGQNGAGTLTVENGGTVSSSSCCIGYAGTGGTAIITGAGSACTSTSDLEVGAGSTGSLTVAHGGKASSVNATVGESTDVLGTAVVTDPGSIWTASYALDVGYFGIGTLTVANGGTVSTENGYIGKYTGSNGKVIITGAGSVWTNTSMLEVGSGTGMVRVENGGKVNTGGSSVGMSSSASGTIIVTGDGSTWTNSGTLYVGYAGPGSLTVGNGGKVTAQALNLNNGASTANLHVSGNGMLVLGNAATTGSITNSGKVNLSADAFLAAGAYSPITAYPGKTITWSGTGSYNGYGGTWDSTAHTFTVAAATTSGAGVANTLTTGERLLITDSGTLKRVGASFGTVAGGTNFSAVPMSGSDLSGLPSNQSILGAWSFTTNFAGDQALLSFDVGAGQSYDMSVWHYNGTSWASFAAPDLTYGDDGIADFAVTSFAGGYALTAAPHDGDANYDGSVDVIDLGVLAKNYDSTGLPCGSGQSWGLADFNDDGNVDVIDLGILAKNYDWSGASAGAVPEPGTATLIALAGLALVRRFHRK